MDAIYWHDGQWTTDNPKLLGPADHAFWMASMVFDARARSAASRPTWTCTASAWCARPRRC